MFLHRAPCKSSSIFRCFTTINTARPSSARRRCLNYLEDHRQIEIESVKVVFSGAGAAAVATANMFVTVGVPIQNIWMCDIAGLIYHGRKQEMFAEKSEVRAGRSTGHLG